MTETPRSFDPAPAVPHRMAFGDVTVEIGSRRLKAPHGTSALEPRAFDLLMALADRPGLTVSSAHLVEMMWGAGDGSGQALSLCIEALRRALGDDAHAPRFIETVPGIGYRWIFAPKSTPAATGWLRRPVWVSNLLAQR
nr:winged helix-turn-helix domain-containing protein [Caulobacter sp. RHG1]